LLRDKNLLGEVDGLLEVLDPREKKSFRSASASTVESRRRSKMLVRTLVLPRAYSPTTEHCFGEAAPRADPEREVLETEFLVAA